MAHQKGIGLRGTFEGTIFYKSMGLYLMRSKPVRVRQTNATKTQAAIFGKAAKVSAALRLTLKPFLPDAKDRKMMLSLDAALRSWLRTAPSHNSAGDHSMPFVTGFEFNKQSLLASSLKVPLTVTTTPHGKLLLHIPSLNPVQQIDAPAHTQCIRWQIIAASCSINDTSFNSSYDTELFMPYVNETIDTKKIELPVDVLPYSLSVVAIALHYYKSTDGKSGLINTMRRKPAGL